MARRSTSKTTGAWSRFLRRLLFLIVLAWALVASGAAYYFHREQARLKSEIAELSVQIEILRGNAESK